MKIDQNTLKAIALEAIRILNESVETYDDGEIDIDSEQGEVEDITGRYADKIKLPRGTYNKDAKAAAAADMRQEEEPEEEEPEDEGFGDDYEEAPSDEDGFVDDSENDLSQFSYQQEPDDENPEPTEYEGIPIEVVNGRYRMVAQESEPRIVLTSGKLDKIIDGYEELWSIPYDRHREWAMNRGQMDFTGMMSDTRLEDLPINYDLNEAIRRALRKFLG